MIVAADADSETARLVRARSAAGSSSRPGRPGARSRRDPRVRTRRARPRGDGPARARVRRARGRPSVAVARYRALLDRGASREAARRRVRSPRDRRRGPLLGLRSPRSSGRTSRYPAFARGARAPAPRPVRAADATPTVAVIVAAHNEEAVIERRVANLLALDYPRDKLEIVVTSDASTDRDRGARRARRRARDPQPARRQGRRAGPRGARDRRRARRLLGRQRDVGARRAAPARARRSPIRTSRTSAAGCGIERADGSNKEGVYWRYELACAAPSRGSARSPAATARSTRCAAPTTSRSIRASGTTSRCRT